MDETSTTPTPTPPPAAPLGASNNPLNLDCWFEGDEIVCASGERIPRHKWYPITSHAATETAAPLTAEQTKEISWRFRELEPYSYDELEALWDRWYHNSDPDVARLKAHEIARLFVTAWEDTPAALRDRLARAEARCVALRRWVEAEIAENDPPGGHDYLHGRQYALTRVVRQMDALLATPTDGAAREGDGR